MLSDLDVLDAIGKGSYLLKFKKLRALGFIQGNLPILVLTEDSKELKRLLAEPK